MRRLATSTCLAGLLTLALCAFFPIAVPHDHEPQKLGGEFCPVCSLTLIDGAVGESTAGFNHAALKLGTLSETVAVVPPVSGAATASPRAPPVCG